MKSHSFATQGVQRTFWDFYFGFGIIIGGYLLVQAVALWQPGTIAKADALRTRLIVAAFLVGFAVNAVLAWKYFLAVPAVMAGGISICLALALVTAGRTSAQ